MKKSLFIVLSLFLIQGLVQAQGAGFGFKVGLSSTKIQGPSETDADGNALEDFKALTAFHVGAMVRYSFTKYVGVRAELLFSQKGGSYRYEGPSYQSFTTTNGSTLNSTGTRLKVINYSNNYFDVPLMVYAFPVKKIRVAAGVNVGILLRSTGNGEVTYSGSLTSGSPVQEYQLTLDHNYLRDAAGEVKADGATVDVFAGSQTIPVPSTLGAYFDETMKDGNYFSPIDLGAIAEVAYRLSGGLEIGARLHYGLLDVTNNYYDYSISESTANFERVSRADVDRNVVLMFSVGFGF